MKEIAIQMQIKELKASLGKIIFARNQGQQCIEKNNQDPNHKLASIKNHKRK